jgi:hypothetical protein
VVREDVAHLHDAEDAGEGDGSEQEYDCEDGVGTHGDGDLRELIGCC